MLRTGPRLPYNPGCMQGKCLLCCRNWTRSAKYQEKGIQVGGAEVSAPRKVRRSQGALPLNWYRGHTIWVFAATFLTGPLNCEVGRCSSWNQRHLPCEQMGLSGLWSVLRQLEILLHYKRPREARTDEGQRAGGRQLGATVTLVLTFAELPAVKPVPAQGTLQRAWGKGLSDRNAQCCPRTSRDPSQTQHQYNWLTLCTRVSTESWGAGAGSLDWVTGASILA